MTDGGFVEIGLLKVALCDIGKLGLLGSGGGGARMGSLGMCL